MTDDAPRWFDDEAEPPARSRRLPALLVAAVVPWVVLAAVLLRGVPATPGGGAPGADVGAPSSATTDQPTTEGVPPTEDVPPTAGASVGDAPTHHDHGSDTDPEPTTTGPDPGADTVLDHEADPRAGATASLPRGADTDGSLPPDHPTRVAHGVAEALVVALTRAWLSDAGPDLEVAGVEADRSGYLEHVTVERIALEGDSFAIATVTVVVLDRDGDRYTGARVRRAAVPLRVTATTVHPAGQPWWLPSPLDLTPAPPETVAVDDDAVTEAVRGALGAAGYRDPVVDEVAVTDDGTLIAAVTAEVPTGDTVRGEVWLRLEAGGTATVLGHHEDDTT